MDLSRHLISLILLVFVLATFFSTALTRHRIRHHRDRFKRQQGAHLYLPGSYVLDGGTGSEPDAGPWTDWGPPSACSRSCGGGVATQVRQCHYDGACRGPDRKHFSCNTQDCPDNGDYRAQQCSEFDRQPFEGVYYQWIPYTKAPNPCELNCMPRGERFYYRHKKSVADGTRCTAEKMDVCVEGKCQPVGCDMMLGSNAREDKCRQCGGNGTTCQTLDGTLDMQDLQVGYNDILLIPAGATNIDVRERSPSNNYLAVRNVTGHYYLNGNWRIDFPKSLRFAGCNFHYERSPQGFAAPDSIVCLGPTYEPLYIVLLYQDINVGVNYEYSIPKAISSDPETYNWIYDDFGACSATCGGGYQTRNVSCAGRRSLEIVEKTLCDASTEPTSTQNCGEQPCEPQWAEGPWGDCSEVCGENGVQTRDVKCERLISNGVSSVVNEQYCIQRQLEKPVTIQDCNRGTPCPMWHEGPWKPCDHLCGEGIETRQVTCFRKVDGKIEILNESYCKNKEKRPDTEKICNIRPCEGVDWVTSEWSGCDKCGLESETRKAHCATQKGEVHPDDLCEGESKPELVRKCEKSKLCDTQWYASQWSECSANCGSGIQTRNVFCGTFEDDTLKKLEDKKCDESKKYDSIMNCTSEEEVCPGEWFSGPWSKCDKNCGSGTRSRKILCMKEEEVIPVSNCDANVIPFTNEQCNEKPCGDDEVLPVNTTRAVEEKDITTETEPPEWDPDTDVEVLEDDEECLDGEWVDDDDDELEEFGRIKEQSTPFGSSLSTDSSLETSPFSDDDGLMLSDSTYFTDDTRETSPFTEEGSGDVTSPVDVTTSSDLTSLSPEPTASTEASSDLSSVEGSGDSTIFETTASGPTGDTTEPGPTGETTASGSDETTVSSDVTTQDSSVTTADSSVTTELAETAETTLAGTDQTSESSDITSVSTDSATDITSDTTDITTDKSDSTDVTTDKSDTTEITTDKSDSTDVTTDKSDSTDVTTDKSESTDVTTDKSESTDVTTDKSDSTEITSDKSDSTDVTTDTSASNLSTDVTEDNTDATSDLTTTSSDSTSDSSTSSSSTDDTPSTTDSSTPTSESTSETTPFSTESSIFTETTADGSTTTDSSTSVDTASTETGASSTSTGSTEPEGSSASTGSTDTEGSSVSTVEVTTSTGLDVSTEPEPDLGPAENDFGVEVIEDKTTKVTTQSVSTSSELDASTETGGTSESTSEVSTSSDVTTESGTTDESTISGATDVTTISGATDGTTISGATDDTTISGSTDVSTVSGDTDETTISGSTEETDTTVSGMTTTSSDLTSESSTSDLSSESPVSTSSDLSSESPASTSSDLSSESPASTSSDLSTESPASTSSDLTSEVTESSDLTTESGSTMSTEFVSTETSGSTESTLFDIWSTTESSFSTDDSSLSTGWGTTPYTIEAITRRKGRKCIKKRPPSCKTSPFGCCSDLVTPAEGPFDKGCPAPKTCNDIKFGCCEDGVSPASGPNFKGCPKSNCQETLFGCCPDDKTPAEGNDFEGCKKEPPPPACFSSEFGCCDDNATAATGPDNKGCKDCETSKFGCCPDGITDATGENNMGCEQEVTTEESQPEDCAKATYGCCPDGQSVAQGEHFKGCDIINKDNCTVSYFGCCPDGTSPALGPEYQGCRMACEDEKYGCCPDRVTAAHGPNQEGCCLVHPHGCCPDNIIPARGPNLEGCGCQYSPYRCCPDNVTTARGHGNEGCGCQHTEHGCCPDRYTPAAGPDNQGCACHTFQFGCCADGLTAAQGPHKQGCGCKSTEFGCCSDDQTPAQGADLAGCDCSSSKYGCCPDGVTASQGEKYDGCQDVPENKQEVCVLAKDRGSCNNYTVKWYFDMEYGGCSRFWYGGCEGNTNRFMSMEECKGTCIEPKGKDICQLPKVTGACEGYYPSWYYDKDRKQCAQFIWGGCLGNANRFETREECQSLCFVDRDQDACEQPREQGPCRGNYRRWYFDKESNTCDQFAYGGCKANNNNFPTEMACKQQCLQLGRKKDLCALPRAQGNCTQKEPRWYFDVSENRCMPFYYSGCGGNNNKFASRDACETDCPTDVERDTCTLPALVGECHNYTERFYYDTKEKRCRLFYYGGCGGNDNNFQSEPACLSRCEQQATTLAPEPTDDFKREHCFLPSETGPCRTSTARWYYDSRDGVCKQFLYGGCQGNQNNFETREECHQRCSSVQDLCDLPMVVGPCNSDYLQWFYEKSSDTCQMFNYGGCQGNENRFGDQESCDRRCKKNPSVVATHAPVEHIYTTRAPYPDHDDRRPVSEGMICYSPVDVGNCSDNQPAWFYDAASQKCQAFVYTGCGGNANRFISEEQCQRHCGSFRGLDVCSHPKDTGSCKAVISKWFYDRDSGRCQEFDYGGCGGSGNRFSFLEECESVCVKLVEPPPSNNETSESHVAICLLPVEVGPCEGQFHQMRWHFDEERRNCVSFIYSGCGGNQNNFNTYQTCMDFCRAELDRPSPQNEIDVNQPPPKAPCEEYRDECTSLLCPYGTEGFVDVELCNRCRCYEPCRDTQCPENTICAIDLNLNATMPHQTQFIPVCRPTNKEGECPRVSGVHSCTQECRTDADCSGEFKCCPTSCGTTCVVPLFSDRFTTALPAYTDAPYIAGGDAPVIVDQYTDTNMSAEEGNYVVLRCNAQGNPPPTITWRRGNELIDGSKPRHRILPDGSLQLVSLFRSDVGLYSCIAENGIGHAARKDISIDITEPSPHPANVLGDEDTRITVTLGAPHYFRCFAYGWPRPTVTWWRGDSMLPLSSETFEQKRDYTLLIRSVRLSNLGVYTCQAYNGLGKAASWSLTVQSLGPVHSSNPEDDQFRKYLIAAPDRPTTPRPAWPFRPTRMSPPRVRVQPTPQPHIPAPYTDPSPEIVPDVIPETPRVYIVPVHTNITMPQKTFPVDSEISIPCDVDGHPVPRVQWYKNNVPLVASEHIQISESHRLTVVRANKDDSGEYLCDAENEYSKSSSSVRISVEGLYIHPNCTDNPFFANCNLIVQAKYCTHKYYAKFCCKSCTQAGQLPSYGPHLGESSRQERPSNFV